ncbi:AMP-binding protein [Bacillus sp. JJ1533]|uniref:phenylacetate--CoA ligase family protein n=1 Tax=Bacillus sp. JJ1533 TaxID=3122959 RepID=UPI002FFDEFE1
MVNTVKSEVALFNQEIESISAESLRELQERKFLRQVEYSLTNSPFYQSKFKEAGLELSDICSLDDIVKIPYTTKQELRDALLKQPPILGENQTSSSRDIVRLHASSGSTGRPTYVGITKKDAELWDESTARTFWACGIRPDDVVAHSWNYSMFVGGLADHMGCEYTGATMVPVGIGSSKRLASMIQDLGITAINATPSYIMYLADVVKKELGIDPADTTVKKIITGGEPGGAIPATRKLIQDTWNAKCCELYGMVDIHPIIGAECEHQNGMHFLVGDLVYPELIDVETGAPLDIKKGVRGEVIYTHIERYTNAVLRFKSHDIIEVIDTECECGRTGYRFKVVGRSDDMLIVKGVNVYPSAVEDVLRNMEEMNGHFGINLEKEGVQQDIIHIVAEFAPTYSGDIESLQRKVQTVIAEKLQFKSIVNLVPEDSLPRFEHKAKRIYRKFKGEEVPVKK